MHMGPRKYLFAGQADRDDASSLAFTNMFITAGVDTANAKVHPARIELATFSVLG